ncbi:asialoglycoprotein receptor 2-like [Microcaecilia unicolor]|uniref:Asialoglycoprotein receptor 2-like n=1 Tax=Microcaecilia unicolor TaxID=1415580 RepID=A0A6P7WWV8_9AMPH|nr:asialoglycoprotein receptor 2-like [Microcaecilia unicolor]
MVQRILDFQILPILLNLEQFGTKAKVQNLSDELQKTNSFIQEWKTVLSGQHHFCMAGWLQNDGNCYYFSKRRKTWEESRKFCEIQDAELLVIKDNRTLSFIRENSNGAGYFIGLKKEQSVWKWIDGTILDKSFNVQVSGDASNCVRVSSGGLWNEDCTNQIQWICEKNAFKFKQFWSSLLPPSFFEHENPTSRSTD